MDIEMNDKVVEFHEGDRVRIHCSPKQKKDKKEFYDNQIGEVIHVWDLKRHPWGNIVVLFEHQFQDCFFCEDLEKLPKED